jgi:hypothetical protein
MTEEATEEDTGESMELPTGGTLIVSSVMAAWTGDIMWWTALPTRQNHTSRLRPLALNNRETKEGWSRPQGSSPGTGKDSMLHWVGGASSWNCFLPSCYCGRQSH